MVLGKTKLVFICTSEDSILLGYIYIILLMDAVMCDIFKTVESSNHSSSHYSSTGLTRGWHWLILFEPFDRVFYSFFVNAVVLLLRLAAGFTIFVHLYDWWSHFKQYLETWVHHKLWFFLTVCYSLTVSC